MPQPLSNKVNRNSFTLSVGTYSILSKPELAAKVMAVISIWSHIDSLYTSIVTECLKSDFVVVSNMMIAINSPEAKRAAITAAIQKAHPNDVKLFEAVETVIKASKKRRNDFAHHIWATCPSVEDSLCLIDPRAEYRREAESKAFWVETSKTGKQPSNTTPPVADLDKIMVYSQQDIEQDLKDAELALMLVYKLLTVLQGGGLGDRMRDELCNQPQVQQVLQPKSS